MFWALSTPQSLLLNWHQWRWVPWPPHSLFPVISETTSVPSFRFGVFLTGNVDGHPQVMDYESLPHFCKREGSGSSSDSLDGVDCYSYDHPFHQQLYNYMKQQQSLNQDSVGPRKQGSVHVDVPSPGLEEAKIAETIKAELQNLRGSGGLAHSFSSIQIEGPWGRAPVTRREALGNGASRLQSLAAGLTGANRERDSNNCIRDCCDF